MRWSGVRISGGSPKQNSLRHGGCFCFTPQARYSNRVRAACRLRNAQSKRLPATFTHSMRFEILILCAYLRWVTKTKQSPKRRLFCFTPQARDSNGVRAACRLRNAQSKRLHATFTHSMRFEILILCAYLRWVTKTKQSPKRRLFLFYAAGAIFEQSSGGLPLA